MASIVLLIFSLNANSAPASAESIKHMMQKTGSGEIGIQAMTQLLPALKRLVPNAPDKFWEDFMAEVHPDDLINMTIPIYQKYLSQADLDAINAFYGTPAGQNLIRTQPLIMQESIAAGQLWGQKLAQDVVNRYKAQQQ